MFLQKQPWGLNGGVVKVVGNTLTDMPNRESKVIL